MLSPGRIESAMPAYGIAMPRRSQFAGRQCFVKPLAFPMQRASSGAEELRVSRRAPPCCWCARNRRDIRPGEPAGIHDRQRILSQPAQRRIRRVVSPLVAWTPPHYCREKEGSVERFPSPLAGNHRNTAFPALPQSDCPGRRCRAQKAAARKHAEMGPAGKRWV